ncbi:hypothetical protein EJB05_02413 [Eragrostis curvula]|uniref:Uncharacterized protein n=1 Tax=Eragrostis curvula TaxID=38414 RepID=A0A5J9WSD8_9POAL|nr:hypothetical protein EJB05_02413 [Eragrostis curvula]
MDVNSMIQTNSNKVACKGGSRTPLHSEDLKASCGKWMLLDMYLTHSLMAGLSQSGGQKSISEIRGRQLIIRDNKDECHEIEAARTEESESEVFPLPGAELSAFPDEQRTELGDNKVEEHNSKCDKHMRKFTDTELRESSNSSKLPKDTYMVPSAECILPGVSRSNRRRGKIIGTKLLCFKVPSTNKRSYSIRWFCRGCAMGHGERQHTSDALDFRNTKGEQQHKRKALYFRWKQLHLPSLCLNSHSGSGCSSQPL